MTIEEWAKQSRAINERVYHAAKRAQAAYLSGALTLEGMKRRHKEIMEQARLEHRQLDEQSRVLTK